MWSNSATDSSMYSIAPFGNVVAMEVERPVASQDTLHASVIVWLRPKRRVVMHDLCDLRRRLITTSSSLSLLGGSEYLEWRL